MADLEKIIQNPVLLDRACICLFGDGPFDGHTGTTLEPYADDPISWGIQIFLTHPLDPFQADPARGT